MTITLRSLFVFFTTIGFLASPGGISAQEAVRSLVTNAKLLQHAASKKKSKNTTKQSVNDSIALPFFDDFSTYSFYPDSSKWADKQAFINSTFAQNMISLGVATLDAIDENGRVYPGASTSTPASADTLTSLPFAIDFTGRTDLYLSFFYQPAGVVEAPDSADRLFLDFCMVKKDSIRWDSVWSVKGSAVKDFKQVILQVPDSFQQRGFRFRFRNLVTISNSSDEPAKHSNADIWNIDYVRLDTGRSAADTILYDVAVTQPMTSLITGYTAIPAKHFIPSYLSLMKSTIDLTFRNNDTTTQNVTRTFSIKRTDLGDDNTQIDAGTDIIEPDSVKEITQRITFPFLTLSESDTFASYKIKGYLATLDTDFKGNDTASFEQLFSNYMAHDDGSAEAGWGLLGAGSGTAYVAYGFKSNAVDTLVGVSIYFNSTEDSVNTQYYFKLSVWNDKSNYPSSQVYLMEDDSYQPIINGLNQFHEYAFPEPIYLKSQRFYIGWKQVATSDGNDPYLNVGFDLNNDSKSELYYNFGTGWEKSINTGAIMVRPIFNRLRNASTRSLSASAVHAKAFPNPTSGVVHITTEGSQLPSKAALYDLSGRIVFETRLSSAQIDLSDISAGFYLLQLSAEKATFAPIKLWIQH